MPAPPDRASVGIARRRRILMAGVASVAVGILCWLILPSSEPELGGKPLSQWVGQLFADYPRRDGEARDALRTMGPPAVRRLTRILERAPSALRLRLASLTEEIPLVHRCFRVPTFDRLVAAKALAEIGPAAKAAIPVLERAAREPDYSLSTAARAALIRIREESVDSYVAIYRQFETSNSAQMAFLLMELGPFAKPALPALLEGMQSTNWRVRIQAVMTLPSIAYESPEYVAPIFRLLSDPNELVRVHAMSGLATFGPLAKTALPKVREALQDTNHLVRSSALLFFDRVLSDEEFAAVRDDVVKAKQDSNSTVSGTADYVLSRRPRSQRLMDVPGW